MIKYRLANRFQTSINNGQLIFIVGLLKAHKLLKAYNAKLDVNA